MSEETTYWNGEPAKCRKVRAVVGKPELPTWWSAGLEGTVREAVEVCYAGETFYIDNEDGRGWWKVTSGMGGSLYGHSRLPVSEIVGPSSAEGDAR